MTRLSDPVGSNTYDERDTRGQRQRDADQEAYEARTEGAYVARFVGLGASDQFEMAPFPSAAEKHAYFERVRAMNEEHQRRYEERVRNAST